MHRFRLFVLLFANLMVSMTARSVSAYPYPITYTQPDGSQITLRLHGDEFLHWFTLGEDVVERGNDGYFHSTGEKFSPSSLRWQQAVMQRAARQIREEAMTLAPKDNPLSKGNKHFLVLLIQTQDVRFTVPSPQKAFSDMLNLDGYSENDGTGSAKEYFTDQSLGKFSPVFDVVGPVTVPDSMKIFTKQNGQTQEGAPLLLAKACQVIDPDLDFSLYDNDNDGNIDNIFFYYAGYNAAEGAEGTIWPHSWSLNARKYTFDGKKLSGYACTSEYRGISGNNMAGIGTFCHEFGHVIGLPDFYDTNEGTDGEAKGLGAYSLMSFGNYNNNGCTPPNFNCEERLMLGWLDSIPPLPDTSAVVVLEPVQRNAGYISPTDSTGEYFYYEYRNRTKWDAPIPGGLLIYHIDKSSRMVNGITAGNRWISGSGINAVADHECFKLFDASGSGSFIPFGNEVHTFNANTHPASVTWSGRPTGYDLYDIRCHQGDSLMAFKLIRNDIHRLFGYLKNKDAAPVADASIVINDGACQTLSDENGYFEIVLDSLTTELSVAVEADGYKKWQTSLSVPFGACYLEISLYGATEREDVLLSKNSGNIHRCIGFNKPQQKTFAKVLFSVEETAPFAGMSFHQVSFVMACEPSLKETVSCQAFLKLNGNTVWEQTPDTVLTNDWTHVNLSRNDIALPFNTSVEIGYWVCSDFGYPLAVDDSPADGSSCYSADGNLWYPLKEDMNNFLITALLKDISTGKSVPLTPSLLCFSHAGVVRLAGLEENLPVHFFAPDGRLMATIWPENGQVEWQASSAIPMVIIRQGSRSVKIGI